jgi:hypothetical protein
MKSNTKFKWHCPHCNHRNSISVEMQFEIPKQYNALWDCDECGETCSLEFSFTVSSWLNNKKTPKLRKRKQEEKKRRKEKENRDTQKDRGYKNNVKKIPT